MATKKAYTAPDAVSEELIQLDVLFGSNYDNIGEDEDWNNYIGGQTL